MQTKLFNIEPNKAVQANNSITKIVSKGKPLSKNQQAFNRLTKKIANLKKQIEEENEKLRTLQIVFEKEVRSEVIKLGHAKIEMAHLLHEKRKKAKLAKADRNQLDDLIYELLDDAFHVISPSDKDKALFNTYNDVSFEEEVERQQAGMSEMLADMFYQQTGLKIDPSVLNDKNPDLEKIQAHLEERLNEQTRTDKKKSNKKKSQRTIDKEAREKQKEALKQKSIRSIYLSLAKILHPDTETDENTKAEKEEYMKRVTVAYNNRSLPELLELEMQWVHKHENQLADTPEQTLELYNDLLKEQVESLEDDLYAVGENPAFSNVFHLCGMPLTWATQALNREKKSYISTCKKYTKYNKMLLRETNSRDVILDCIDDFLTFDRDDDFDDFFLEEGPWRF
ncbi:MAG: J domain-containing protein [Chitinophagaceae bacterium]|nr:J domain-containing protein [Chitinophagaceae bacterium]